MARLFRNGIDSGTGLAYTDKLNCGSAADIDDMTAAGTYLLVLSSVRRAVDADNLFVATKCSATTGGWELLLDGPYGSTKGYPRVLIWTSGARYDVATSGTDRTELNAQEIVGFQHDGAGAITIYRGPIQSAVVASTGLSTIVAGSGTIGADAAADLLVGNAGRSNLPFSGDIGWTCIYKRATAFTDADVNTIRAAMVQAVGGDIAGGVTAMKTVSGYTRLIYLAPDATVSATTAIDYAPASPTNLGTGITGTAAGTDYVAAGPPANGVLVQSPALSVVTGAALFPAPIIEIQDAAGVRTTSTLTVSARITLGDGTLGGTTSLAAVNGRATFANLTLTDPNGGQNTILFEVDTIPGGSDVVMTVDTSIVTEPATFTHTRNAADFTGTDRVCATAADLTAALAACVDGDQILLAPGATFLGQFTLRNRGTTGWVEIRTNISDATLDAACPEGSRMTPTLAASLNLATISGNSNTGAIISAFGARGYRLTAIKVQDAGNAVNGLVRFGDTTMTSDSQICQYMIANRCYLKNSGSQNVRRAIYASCKYWALTDSWVENMVDGNTDAQAVTCFGCAGPAVIQNNYLEGWAETVLFGGGNSGLAVDNLNSVPSDVIIRYNYMTRNVAFKGTGSPYTGQKNGIEFKDVRRLLMEYNIIERTWAEGQVGNSLLIKSDNAQAARPLNGSQDIEVRYNWFRDMGSGLTVAANPDGMPQINKANRIWIHNNLFERINQGTYTGVGVPIYLAQDLRNIYIDHNTFVKYTEPGGGVTGFAVDADLPSNNIVVRSNILHVGGYGVKAGGQSSGTGSMNAAWTSYTWLNNLLVGYTDVTAYPATTLGCSGDATVGYTDLAAGGAGYALAASSAFKAAGHDGADVGIANVASLFTGIVPALEGTGGGVIPPATPVPTSLEMIVQPAGFVTGVAGTTQPQVRVLDQNGAVYTAAAVTITALIATGTGTITVGATANSSTSTGIATFSGLTVTSPYTTPLAFTFTATGVASVNSSEITLTVPDVPTPTTDPVLVLTYDWGLADPNQRLEPIARGRAVGAARTLIPALKNAPVEAVLDAAIAELIYSASIPKHGSSAQRPPAADVPRTVFYDDTLNKPIWSDGTVWRDSAGTIV